MEYFEKAASVRLKGPHNKFLWAHIDKSVYQGSADEASVWTVECVTGRRAIRLKSVHDLYLTAADFSFLLGLTGKKVQQSYASKADSAVEWEPIKDGPQQVRLGTKRGTFLRANAGFPPYRNSVTHDNPRNPSTQNWVLWEVQIVKTVGEGSPIDEDSTRLSSSYKEKEHASISQHEPLSPNESISSKAKSKEEDFDDVGSVFEKDFESPSKPTQVPRDPRQMRDLWSRGHSSSKDRGSHRLERPSWSQHENLETSKRSSLEGEEDYEDVGEGPTRRIKSSNISQEYLPLRRNNAAQVIRESSRHGQLLASRQNYESFDEGENEARLQHLPRRNQQSTYHDGSEGESGTNLGSFDDTEEMTPRSRHAQVRKHQGYIDDRQRMVRNSKIPPRSGERYFYEEEHTQRVEQSPSRSNDRFVEGRDSRQRIAEFAPRRPRRIEKLNEGRDERHRVHQTPPRRNGSPFIEGETPRRARRTTLDEREEHSWRDEQQTPGSSSSNDEEYTPRDVSRSPLKGEPMYDGEQVQRSRQGGSPTNSEEQLDGRRPMHMRGGSPTTSEEEIDESQPTSRSGGSPTRSKDRFDGRRRIPLSVGSPTRSNESLHERRRIPRGGNSPTSSEVRVDERRIPRRGGSPTRSEEWVDERRQIPRRGGSPARSEEWVDERRRIPRRGRSPARSEEWIDERRRIPRRGGFPARSEEWVDERRRAPRRGESSTRRGKFNVDEEDENPFAKHSPPPRRRSSSDNVDSNSSRRSSQRVGMRRIFFSISDEYGESAGLDDEDWGSFMFEGETVQDLKEELQERTGIMEDIYICVRSPISGKLNVLHLNLPPVNGPLQLEIVLANSAVGQALAKPQSVRTRQSRENLDFQVE